MSVNPNLLAMVKNAKKQFSANSGNVIKLKEGKTRVRILMKDPTVPFHKEYAVHWIKTEIGGKPQAVVGCKHVSKDEPCEVCSAIDRAATAASDTDTVTLIKEWKGKRGVLVNALIRDGANAKDEPQVLELTPTTFGNICGQIEEYALSDINVLDPNDGCDFIIERSGKGLDTKYNPMIAPKSAPVPAGVLEKLIDLEDFVEKNFFRGEEAKAVRLIAGATGISTAGLALTGPAAKAPALAAPAATVVETEVSEAELEVIEEAEVTTAPAVAPTPKPAPKPAAKPAAQAAKPAAPAAAEPATDFNSALPQDEIDSMLGELDNI